MKRLTYILLGFILLLSSCKLDEGSRVCGVKVQGTPWELLADIVENGDGTFVPEDVTVIGGEKGYVQGWYNTNVTTQPWRESPYDDGFIPATLIIESENNRVLHAWVYVPLLDNKEE